MCAPAGAISRRAQRGDRQRLFGLQNECKLKANPAEFCFGRQSNRALRRSQTPIRRICAKGHSPFVRCRSNHLIHFTGKQYQATPKTAALPDTVFLFIGIPFSFCEPPPTAYVRPQRESRCKEFPPAGQACSRSVEFGSPGADLFHSPPDLNRFAPLR